MTRLIWLLFLTALSVGNPLSGQEGTKTYYVQLIRGTDQERPEDPKWKPIGPKLSRKLSPVFRWNHYWEVNRQTVTVMGNKPVKTRLSPEREVEVRMASEKDLEILLHQKGKLTRKSRQGADANMTILGGDREVGEAWFVVVRREKPQ